MNDRPFHHPRRWAARLAFPLVAVAVLWSLRVAAEPGTTGLEWAGIVGLFAAGLGLLVYGRGGRR